MTDTNDQTEPPKETEREIAERKWTAWRAKNPPIRLPMLDGDR